MKNVYFVQVDVSASIGVQSAYLPYTAGILAAAAWESDIVKKHYRFCEFIFLRENVRDAADRMDSPAFAAFSNYCWNTEYNKRLAEEIKKRYPECVIVFGGHNVPDSFEFLKKYPYIDILCHGEGENTIRLLMEALALDKPLREVPNISFRTEKGDCLRTGNACAGPLNMPSPYLDGWFDGILSDHPEITFNAILETSRGCPNRCAYCDWGLLRSKVRFFPLERIKNEIRWMAGHRIAFVWGADANFGLFDRDLEIADALVEAKRTTGYPERIRINYAKNKFENVFSIVKKFKECDLDRLGATLSFQSMSPVVLKNIGRTNNDLEFYKKLLTRYNAENMKAYSELILGLPGETYESFIKGIGTLFEIGQHFVFEVYDCILLPNSEMGQPEYIKKHGIKTVTVEIVRPHFKGSAFDIPEYNSIIVATDTMSIPMWVRANTFFYIAKAFHASGLLRAFAVYLYAHRHLPYERFYDAVIDYFEDNPELFTSLLYFDIKKRAEDLSTGLINQKMEFAPCGDVVWEDHEYMVLHILENIDMFFEDITPFLRGFDIPDDVFDDLIGYQRGIMRRPEEKERRVRLHHDVHKFLTDAYINNIRPLEKKEHTLILRDTDTHTSWLSFGKYVVWYGRMGWTSYKDTVIYID